MIEQNVIRACRHDEYREALKKILEYEEQEKDRKDDLDIRMFWEYSDVKVKPHILNELYMDAEVIDMPFGSSGSTNKYALVDREITKQVLDAFEDGYYEYEDEQDDTPIEEVEVDLSVFDKVIEVRPVDKKIKKIMKRAVENPGIHVCLVGGPGTGKSLIASCIEKSTRSTWISGTDMTKASIRDNLMENKPRFVIIDELDKYNSKEAVQILSEPMEDQTLTTQVSGKEAERVEMPINVFATANYWNLPDNIEDRFLPLRLPEYTDEQFARLILEAFTEHEGIDEGVVKSVLAEALERGIRSYRRCLQIARLCDEPDDVKWIVETFDLDEVD